MPVASESVRVVANGLTHSFGDTELFRDLSFTIEPGEVVALVGPSGSRKSTLLGILAGWQKPTRGAVERSGIHSIGWVFQNPHGVARRTALDHVVLPLLARGARRRDAESEALALLARFGLIEVAAREFRRLSGGEAQRLMLARATAATPQLLLVDEPTAQLDRHTASTVNEVLAAIARDDAIVVIATHDAETRAACHRSVDLGATP